MSLVEAARAYLGTPFHHCGRVSAGLDCSGLVILALRDCGVEVDAPASYSKDDHFVLMQSLVESVADRVEGDPRPGDVALFRSAFITNHVAIITEVEGGNMAIIHAWDGVVGKVVECPLDGALLAALVGVYRVRGL